MNVTLLSKDRRSYTPQQTNRYLNALRIVIEVESTSVGVIVGRDATHHRSIKFHATDRCRQGSGKLVQDGRKTNLSITGLLERRLDQSLRVANQLREILVLRKGVGTSTEHFRNQIDAGYER